MARSDTDFSKDRSPPSHSVKKCPECYAYLSLDASKCPECGARLKEVDWLGFAKRPIDWRGYLIAAAAVLIYCVFMWWAFFRE